MRVLSECKKQIKFKAFLDDLKKTSFTLLRKGLEGYLFEPVQRIPVCIYFNHVAILIFKVLILYYYSQKYSSFLQDLLTHTNIDHCDRKNLIDAVSTVNAVLLTLFVSFYLVLCR